MFAALYQWLRWLVGLGIDDKIAIIAVAIGLLQTIVLYLTIRVMRRTARQQMRAYISARPNFISSFDETHGPTTKFEIRNLGQTPAYHLRHRSEIDALPFPLPRGFRLPPITSEWTLPLVLFPDVPLDGHHTRGTPFSAEQLAGIRDRSLRVYIFGEIRYNDAFAKRRWLKFCSSVDVTDGLTLQKLTWLTMDRLDDFRYEIATAGNSAN